ncbi:hypothetical protein C4K31_2435 [Pseudomonas chlororaphis subsp. piscium]|nr:hypothetical protein C4K31_2435 [Pseudomonas chlororaphis subsp. piscium]
MYSSNSFFGIHMFFPYFFHISFGGNNSIKSTSANISTLPTGSVE